MQDARTRVEKWLWQHLGPPLYYCADCLRGVKVVETEGEPRIERKCSCTGQVIAPRKAVAVGKGGMTMATRVRVAWDQMKASATGRCA